MISGLTAQRKKVFELAYFAAKMPLKATYSPCLEKEKLNF